jgi:hypothetical protein
MIFFSLVGAEAETYAFDWHTAFTEDDKSVFPRTREQFHRFVANGMAWAATDEKGAFLGLAYASQEAVAWEIGGLAVTVEAREKGVGLLLAYLTLGHLLFEEDPLANDPPRPLRIIVHVLKTNPRPRAIIENILRFRIARSVRVPGHELPGLETDDEGFVCGDEFEISIPDTLHVLADWADRWDGKLRSGEPAHIELRDGVTLAIWAEAFRQMTEQGEQ